MQGYRLQVGGPTSHEGFTVIEVLVSMSIFAIAILGLAVGATSIMRANQTSYFSTIATNSAQDKLEEFKAKTASALPNCPTYTTSGCSDSPSYSGLSFNRSWRIITNSPIAGVNQIDVKMDWTDYIAHSLTISSAVKP